MRTVYVMGVTILMIMVLLTGCGNNEAEESENEKTEENSKDKHKEEEKDDVIEKKIQPKELATVFLAGEYERIYNQASKEFKQEVSLEQLQEIGETFNKGVQGYQLQAHVPLDKNVTRYIWSDETETKGITAVMEGEQIMGFRAVPMQPHPKTDEAFTKTTFKPPFEDEWFVFWGGINPLVNYHYAYENQRYAFDFLIMRDERTYKGDASKNESYYAFGENVLAPADGKIVDVKNDIEDNEPTGEMNEDEMPGNYVTIDHGNDEYSLLAHFKQGSINVKKGDQVKQGDLLGLAGNSGNSSEPHIHFHVADSPDLADSKSIRIRFADDADWIQGDIAKGQ